MKSSTEYAASVRRKAAERIEARKRRRRAVEMTLVCVLCIGTALTTPYWQRASHSSAEHTAYASDISLKSDASSPEAELDAAATASRTFQNFPELNRFLADLDPHWATVPIPQLPDYRLTTLCWAPSSAAIRAEYHSAANRTVVCTVVQLPSSADDASYVYRTANGAVSFDLSDLPRSEADRLTAAVTYLPLAAIEN